MSTLTFHIELVGFYGVVEVSLEALRALNVPIPQAWSTALTECTSDASSSIKVMVRAIDASTGKFANVYRHPLEFQGDDHRTGVELSSSCRDGMTALDVVDFNTGSWRWDGTDTSLSLSFALFHGEWSVSLHLFAGHNLIHARAVGEEARTVASRSLARWLRANLMWR